MKKFDGILICSDIDGTIFYQPKAESEEKGYIPENVCRAIRYFQENGGRFTLATGRFPKYARRKLSRYLTPNAPLVTLNGAVIYDAENDIELFTRSISDDIARLSYDVLERYTTIARLDLQCADNCSLNITRTDRGYKYVNALDPDDKYHFIDSREEFLRDFSDRKVYKILYFVTDEESDHLKEMIASDFPEYAVARSWKNGVELQCADADKGSSTRRLADMLGDVRLLVCAGDFENDITMLKSADVGYAVNDARENVKDAADRITAATCKEGAMEEIIRDIEKEFGLD